MNVNITLNAMLCLMSYDITLLTLCYVMLCYVTLCCVMLRCFVLCGVFYALLWRFVAFFCPKCAILWHFVAKSGKKVAKNGQKLGKKWPILSRMGELLKGSFFCLFSCILSHPRGGVAPHGMGGYPHRGSPWW